jgi:hypothetical protein
MGMDTGGGFNLPSDMGGGGTDTLGGVPETNADMNMGTGNASSSASNGAEETGGMPNIDLTT